MAGDVNGSGSFGVGEAESHAGGIQNSVIKTVSNVESNIASTFVGAAPVEVKVETSTLSPIFEPATVFLQTETSTVQTVQSVQSIAETDLSKTSVQTEQTVPAALGPVYLPQSAVIERSDASDKTDELKVPEESDQSEQSEQIVEPIKPITTQIIKLSTTSTTPITTSTVFSTITATPSPTTTSTTSISSFTSSSTLAPVTTVNNPPVSV